MKLLCRIFGHRLFLKLPATRGISGPWVCLRCGYEEPGVIWPPPSVAKLVEAYGPDLIAEARQVWRKTPPSPARLAYMMEKFGREWWLIEEAFLNEGP